MKKYYEKIMKSFEVLSKIVGGVAALIAVLAIILPDFIWNPVEAKIASIYGINGWVYYEVGENRELTNDGGLFLLNDSAKALYPDIRTGDKLRLGHDVNVRKGPTNEHPVILVLEKGVCLIVTETPKYEKKDLVNAVSGGRLKITTTSCLNAHKKLPTSAQKNGPTQCAGSSILNPEIGGKKIPSFTALTKGRKEGGESVNSDDSVSIAGA